MAQLTGFLPDGTPTSAQQQQDLSNLWMVAQQTGTIPNQLADLYGLQRGSRTQDAIAQAAQIGISQQNANTSSFSASNSAGNAAFGRLMDIWQATGSAPPGIPGVQAGTPYGSEADRAYQQMQIDAGNNKSSSGSTSKPTKNEIEADLYTNIDEMISRGQDLKAFFKAEKNKIIAGIGKSGYDELKAAYGVFD